ncbi:hypothetical protein OG589_41860 [Sphaerisporangium sp. NBC_01403]|uniref:hypothetical protein n=1 Tax=Sphaerisporangium sp. NBC_01403 TaxID=2903599 RepID=UPI0032482C35
MRKIVINVTPYVVGTGPRLFDGVPAGALEPDAARSTPTGSLLLRYRYSTRRSS